MTNRRTTAPGAPWDMPPEMQPGEKVALYNRKKNAAGHLKIISDEVYSGLLRFSYCPDGSNTFKSHDLHVTSDMTCSDVIPLLSRHHLVPQVNGMADTPTQGHISLVQGEMERVLEEGDKPLQIALDCSTKGLASPKFMYRPPNDLSPFDGLAPHRMRTSHFTSYVGALASSNPNLTVTSSSFPVANQSPNLPINLDRNRWLSTDGDQNSLYSADSYNSLYSGSRAARKLQHMSKSVSALEHKPKSSPQRAKLVQTLSSDNSEQNTPPVSAMHFLKPPAMSSHSPSSKEKSSHGKTSVGNFITRSLRVGKKLKLKGKLSKSLLDNGADSESQDSPCQSAVSLEEREASAKVSSFVSPVLADRKITMSTVMHIYYKDATEALIYKSLLVSQKAKAWEVVSQALKRFDMTTADPKDFSLFVVVGRWEDVSRSVENEANMGPGSLSLSNISLLTTPRPAVTSIEEFVVCYSREISAHECPYNLQFYFTMQEGYTRRFELRHKERRMHSRIKSRSHDALDMKEKARNHLTVEGTPKRLSWATTEVFGKGDSPLFGDTSHRRRGKRHNRTSNSPRSALILEGSDTEEDILDNDGKGRVQFVAVNGSDDKKDVNEVKLRERKVAKAAIERGSVDELDSCVTEESSPHHRQPLLSATSSSPDSGVVSFSKDKRSRHHSADFPSSANRPQSNHLESASPHIPTNIAGSLPPPQLSRTAFLLSLKLHNPEKELLIQPLEATMVHIAAGSEGLKPEESEDSSSTQHICLRHPDLAHHTRPLCSIQQQTDSSYIQEGQGAKVYVLLPTYPNIPVHLNGNVVAEPTPLSHGDLLSICNECYLFLFQDYSSLSVRPSLRYSWRPHPLNHLMPSSPLFLPSTPPPSSPIIKEVRPTRKDEKSVTMVERERRSQVAQLSTEENLQPDQVFITTSAPLSPLQYSVSYPYHTRPSQGTGHSHASSHGASTELSENQRDAACQTPTPLQQRRHTTSDDVYLREGEERRMRRGSEERLHHRRGSDTPTKNVGFNSLQRRPKKSHRRHHLSSSSSSVSSVKSATSSPSRKSLFSFNLSEEEDLLRYLVSDLDVSKVTCCLGPALLLAMCIEYCHKCHGPAATSRFLQKTVDSLQEVVWDCTKKLTQWKPDPAMASRPLSHCEGLFPLLQPTVFWLANALELHHLVTQSCTPLANQPTKPGENPVNTLNDILVYAFQQMFYTVSKVLFYSLPLVLDGCKREREEGREVLEEGGEDEIVEQAVDFLQALLDLMMDLHLHLEVVSCFYANLFFFINTTLLNSVMQLGPQRRLFNHSAGTTLRSSLTLLEGWACQVGFKDAVLHHLAKLSSILDILATPPHQLVQLSWDELRDEFPVLHPAQLHLLLTHYTPPPSLTSPPHWAPTPTDTSLAYDNALVSESYDCHPGFTLPLNSYTLQLNKPPPQQAEFQALVEDLHTALKHSSKSVDVVPVVENAPSAQVPTLLTNLTTPHTSQHHSHNHHHHHHHHHHTKGEEIRGSRDNGQDVSEKGSNDAVLQNRVTESTLSHAHSHEILHNGIPNTDTSGIGSNTESRDNLLDTHGKNCHNQKNTLEEKSNSGSKVADLISTYEETAKLSQSSSDSVKSSRVEEGRGGDVEIVGKGKVSRVMSMMMEQSCLQPQTLVLREVHGCDESISEEWEPSSLPDGAHLVNIQRGDKGFGVVLVEQKDPITGSAAIYVEHIVPGSTGDQCKSLTVGDKVLAIDDQRLGGADYLTAQKYLKEAEDDVQLLLAPRPLTINSQ